MIFYETGVAISPTDLLSKMETFAEAHGWAADAPSTPADARVIWNGSGGTIFAAIDPTSTSWVARACRGFSGASAFNAQPGDSGFNLTMNLGAGPYASYHLFVGDEAGHEHIHLVVEVVPGEFRHWSLGQLVPAGVVTTGNYLDCTGLSSTPSDMNQPDSANSRALCDTVVNAGSTDVGVVWVDYDGKTDNWQKVVAPSGNTLHLHGSVRANGIICALTDQGMQNWNMRTPMYPMVYYANRASSRTSPIGRIPNARHLSMQAFAPGQVVTVGGVDWQAFPMFRRQTTAVGSGTVSSGLYGYAYQRP